MWVCVDYVPSTENRSKIADDAESSAAVRAHRRMLGDHAQRGDVVGVLGTGKRAGAAAAQSPPMAPASAVTVMNNGDEQGKICASAALARGLTMVNLSDTWTPTFFAPTADGTAELSRPLHPARERARSTGSSNRRRRRARRALRRRPSTRNRARRGSPSTQRHACHAAMDPKHDPRARPQAVARLQARRRGRRGGAGVPRRGARKRARAPKARRHDDARERCRSGKIATRAGRNIEAQHDALVAAEQDLQFAEGWLIDKDTDGTFSWRTGKRSSYSSAATS